MSNSIAERLYGPRCNADVHEHASECKTCAPVLVDGYPLAWELDDEPASDEPDCSCRRCLINDDPAGCLRNDEWECPICGAWNIGPCTRCFDGTP